MANRSGRYNIFIKAVNSIEKSKQKAEETRLHIQRLSDMQSYVDLSSEKLSLLFNTITKDKDQNTNKTLLEMGCVVYIELLEVVDKINEILTNKGIKTLIITGKTTQKQRELVSNEFMEDPHNKVVLFSSAGSESIDLNSTPHLILYNVPKGPKNFSQVIGRICRGFGEFTSFIIHEIIIEETLDEYKQVLLSSKRELEQTILNSDTIPLKQNIGSFDAQLLKKIRNRMLWKLGKRRKP